MKNTSLGFIEAVDIVDYLMTCYRNNIEPTSEKKAEAYEAGINVSQLKRCMEEVDATTSKSEEQWDDPDCEEE